MNQDVFKPYRQGSAVNYYDVLQVSPSASQEVIHAAYRALARACHPDVNPSAAAARRMLDLNAAYTVLSDSTRRAQYDLRRTRTTRGNVSAFPTQPPPSVMRGKPRPSSPKRIEDERAARGVRMSMRPRLLTVVVMVVVLGAAVAAALWLTSALLEDVPDGQFLTEFLVGTAQPFLNHG
jgi:hypothetical protein